MQVIPLGKPPELGPFEWLIRPGHPSGHGQLLSEEELTGPAMSTRVWVADVNGDGKLDLLVGDSVTLVSPAKGLKAGEFKKKFATWQSAFAAASKELSSETADQTKRTKAADGFNKIYNERTEFMKEDPTGFVWLYLQK